MTAGVDCASYARALFELSEEAGKSDAVLSDFELAVKIFELNPDYVKLLDTPAVSSEEKLCLLDRAFSQLDGNLLSLLKILCERRAVYLSGKIQNDFRELYDGSRGILRVEAISAVPLTKAQKDAISKKLISGYKKVIVANKIDSEILGGLKLRYDGIQLDGSLKTRLSKLEEGLKNIII